MAPKKPEDKAHMTSSSQEEESGSSEVESSDDEAVDIPAKKPEAESEDEFESESESESDTEPTQKTTPPESSTSKLNKTKTSDTEHVKKPEADSEDESESESDSEPTQKTTPKRKPTEVLEAKKKKKIKNGDNQEEDVKKKMFARLFSETDEIALLQGILDFGDPYKNIERFVDDVKKNIVFNASRNQLLTKIQRLKKKYRNNVKNSLKRGKAEGEITFSKELDQQCFNLSRKIWGENGVLVSKSRNKKKDLVAHSPKQNGDTVRVDGVVAASVELARFFKSENVSLYSLNESQLVVSWDMVEDGPKKRAVEDKLRKLKLMQGELCMQRSGHVADSAKVIFKDNASSSGM